MEEAGLWRSSLQEGAKGSSCLSHLSNKDLLQGHSAFFLPWQPGCLGLHAKGSLARPRQGTGFHPGFLGCSKADPRHWQDCPSSTSHLHPPTSCPFHSLPAATAAPSTGGFLVRRGGEGRGWIRAGGMPWRKGCQQERTSNIPPCWKCSLA